MKSKYIIFAKDVLTKSKNKPLTAGEIWKLGNGDKYFEKLGGSGETPSASFRTALTEDQKKEESVFIQIPDTTPIKYKLRYYPVSKSVPKSMPLDKTSKSAKNNVKNKINFYEIELHPYLTYFVYKKNKIYTKTIYHQKTLTSEKKKPMNLKHPDLVGVHFPAKELKGAVINISNRVDSNNLSPELYSYELKRDLKLGNKLNYAFSQAQTNSSWANKGYLVTGTLELDNTKLIEEVKELSKLSGIGVIKLDRNNPDKSEIICEAKENKNIEKKRMNELCANPDFEKFLAIVNWDLDPKFSLYEYYDEVGKDAKDVKRLSREIKKKKSK